MSSHSPQLAATSHESPQHFVSTTESSRNRESCRLLSPTPCPSDPMIEFEDIISMIQQTVVDNIPACQLLQRLQTIYRVREERHKELLKEKEERILVERIGRADDCTTFQKAIGEEKENYANLTEAQKEQLAGFAKIKISLRTQIEAAEAENLRLKREVEQFKMQRAKEQEKLEEAEGDNATLRKDINVLHQIKTLLEKLLADANDGLKEKEQTIQTCKESSQTLKDEITALETNVKAAQASYDQTIASLKSEVERKDSLILQQERHIESKESEITKLGSQVLVQQAAVETTEGIAATAKQQLDEAIKEKNENFPLMRACKRKNEEYEEAVAVFARQFGFERVTGKRLKLEESVELQITEEQMEIGDTIVVEDYVSSRERCLLTGSSLAQSVDDN